ncbi:MAG TPA: succinylglutamate desuccinylase/aspartoacylase family protein [Xanthomonadaceae bacterium]|nr:succinylglutamate desuccinylase/aspartoacylase family protein [Xanthomonadaceae bacterium]
MRALQRLSTRLAALALGCACLSPALAQEAAPAPAGPAATTPPPVTPAAPGTTTICVTDADGKVACISPMLDQPGPPPAAPFELVGETVQPGTRVDLEWQGVAGDGIGQGLPVSIVHGKRSGLVLCLFAAVHGDELNGIQSVRRVLDLADPETMAGTLVGVPVVNLGGYARGSRYLPDRRDLNRAFPGSPRGSAAARLANTLFDGIVRHCDALVDFHTGSFDRDNLPQVRADLRSPASLELARGFGATVVLHSPGQPGMLRRAASEIGVPAATFEVGAPGVLQPAVIDVAVAAIARLMQRLGLHDTGVPLERVPQAVFYASRWIRADTPGLLLSEVALGDVVAKGQLLGRVIDPLRDDEADVRAPSAGHVLGMSQNRQVLPGFALFHLGDPTSEAEAVHDAAVAPEDADDIEEDPETQERD